MSGILKRLGYHVPQPEVPADPSNPKGFAESKWVVDFHVGLLKAARVITSDARPDAWPAAAAAAGDNAANELNAFLRRQFAVSDHVLIKDPRLVWFLPLWRRVAADLGVTPRHITMLRHPAAVVTSKSKHYGSWQGDVSRAAGWVNTMLYTERGTRDQLRVFVRYDDLLADWPRVVAGVADALHLGVVSQAPSGAIREADGFVDHRLSRSVPAWSDVALPGQLQDLAERVWELLGRLADKESAVAPDLLAAFDAVREDYVGFYRACEAVTESTVTATIKGNQRRSSASVEKLAARAVPERWRRKVPLRWRRVILAALGQSGRG